MHLRIVMYFCWFCFRVVILSRSFLYLATTWWIGRKSLLLRTSVQSICVSVHSSTQPCTSKIFRTSDFFCNFCNRLHWVTFPLRPSGRRRHIGTCANTPATSWMGSRKWWQRLSWYASFACALWLRATMERLSTHLPRRTTCSTAWPECRGLLVRRRWLPRTNPRKNNETRFVLLITQAWGDGHCYACPLCGGYTVAYWFVGGLKSVWYALNAVACAAAVDKMRFFVVKWPPCRTCVFFFVAIVADGYVRL